MSDDPINLSTFTYTVLAASMVIFNGLITLSNSAMEAVSRSKISQWVEDDKNDIKAKRLLKFAERPYLYRYPNKLLNYVFMSAGFLSIILMREKLIISLIIYFLCIISFSEIFPRKLAKQHSEGLARGLSALQNAVSILMLPVIWIALRFANLILLVFKLKTDVDEQEYSEEEIMSILEVGQLNGSLKEEGKKMIGSIFQFDDERAYEIMTPRTDVFMIDITAPPEEYVDQLMQLRYTRMPVCRNGSDDIIGILHIKDYLIKAREAGFDKVNIEEILRKPYFVPETKKIDTLFVELQKERQHIAILIDEYGGFSGIVTVEDIIEEIVGEIDDEYDEEEVYIEKIEENVYLVDGNVDLDDLNEELGTTLFSETSETLGGFIIDILGEIPKEGYVNQTIEFENLLFTILYVKERRIEKIKLKILNKKEKDEFTEYRSVLGSGDDTNEQR
ncbi:MAG: hemolysin family protein [Hornefia sp.]|nr:hemolysin family protein [Hornefia sp.]